MSFIPHAIVVSHYELISIDYLEWKQSSSNGLFLGQCERMCSLYVVRKKPQWKTNQKKKKKVLKEIQFPCVTFQSKHEEVFFFLSFFLFLFFYDGVFGPVYKKKVFNYVFYDFFS